MCLKLSANWSARHTKDIADSINQPILAPFDLDLSHPVCPQYSILNAPRNSFISEHMSTAL
jgi:hypothetical protein